MMPCRRLSLMDYITVSVVCLVLSISAAFRVFGIDRDHNSYFDYYYNPESKYGDRFEPAFRLIITTMSNLSFDYMVFLFIVAFFSLLLKFVIIWKLCRDRWFWVVFYSLAIYPLHEMTQLRSAISLGFVYYSSYLIQERKYLMSAVGFLGAASFHYSAFLFGLYAIFSPLLRYSRYMGLLMIGIVPVTGIALNSYGLEYMPAVLASYYEFEGGSIDRAKPISSRPLALGVVLILGFAYLKKLSDSAKFWYYQSWLGIVIYLSHPDIPIVAFRFIEATMMSYFFWVSSLPTRIKVLAMSILFTYAIYFFYSIMYITPFFE